LQRLNRTAALAQNTCDFLDGDTTDDPKQKNISLSGDQPPKGGGYALVVQLITDDDCRISERSGFPIGHHLEGRAAPHSAFVDHPAMGNGEYP
jgi:hypothetical protein